MQYTRARSWLCGLVGALALVACGDSSGDPTGDSFSGSGVSQASQASQSSQASLSTTSPGTDASAGSDGTGGEGTTTGGATDEPIETSDPSDATATTGPPPMGCGDGVVMDDEECDDGDDDNTDECLDTCVAASCGDGFVQAGVEACDDGNNEDGDDCTSECSVPSCGDGELANDEECDDGNNSNTDACLNTCLPASCGDGYVQEGVEECDDGVASAECDADCTPAVCGDGVVNPEAGEGCDDGNDDDSDACVTGCAVASCGDGFVQDGVEQCDDGGQQLGDGCDDECALECGNQGEGDLIADNGTNMNVFYCYNEPDSIDTRAMKACHSHFGIGNCCLIPGGYSGLQWGECGAGGGANTIHWHPDAHPQGHCAPFYVPGDVVAPGWCGTILGSFLN